MTHKNVEDAYPLSPMQEGMLFTILLEGGERIYVGRLICRLKSLDAAVFESAWQWAVDRHSVLRSAFVWEQKKPIQVVGRNVGLPMVQEDWRQVPPGELESKLADRRSSERARGFKLSKAPLLRLVLLRLDRDTHHFILTHHHMLMDGWSMALVLKEVLTAYRGLCRGEEPRFEPSRPYRDYIAWLQQQDLAQAESYWRQELRGFTAPPPLGADRMSAAAPTGQDAAASAGQVRLLIERTRMSEAATVALRSLAKEYQFTLSTVVRGAWALLLSRYSGKEDVLFGTVFSGRPPELQGIESMVGVFINTLPVRVRIPPAARLFSWLGQLQAQQAELRQYEYTPLAQIQQWSEMTPGTPLFESFLVFENYPVDQALAEKAGDLEISDVEGVEEVDFPLNAGATLISEVALQLTIGGDPNRFDRPAVRRVLNHLKVLLEEIARAPDRSLRELSVLAGAERHQLLVEWNDARVEQGENRRIQQLPIAARFELQVERSPEAIAVRLEDRRLTYSELNARSNRLARHLQSLGVGPEVPIGICMAASVEAIVAILGVLKAGGAYVPVDPAYPAERLAWMLEDAGVAVVLTLKSLGKELLADRAPVVYLDTDAEALDQHSDRNPANDVVLDHLAYTLYTSGSTGKPKGVCCSHRGVLNLLADFERRQPIAPGMGCTLWTRLSFDVSVYEVFSALLAGGRLEIVPERIRADGEAFAEWLHRQQMASAYLPAFALDDIVAWLEENPSGLDLRRVLVGVEPIPEPLLATLAERVPGLVIINGYGPTEATSCTALFDVDPGRAGSGKTPIGRPVANAAIYLLDKNLQPVPAGVLGDLHASGVGLARGYLHSPALTAERFIPDPWSHEPGGRLYRTGDLARRLADGNIEFVGRVDHQLKVRGFRIEPGEIEAALGEHPQVKEAVAVVREDRPGNKLLVAYFGAEKPEAALTDELRELLDRKLPEHMVPTVLVGLKALPRTPAGKVDRRALPAPESPKSMLEDPLAAPRDLVEEAVLATWKEVLGVEQIRPDDNFFDLGGHSLLATRAVARIQKLFQVELSQHDVFHAPTLAEFVARVEQEMTAGQAVETRAIEPVPRDQELPLSFAQQRLWFVDQLEPGSTAYNMVIAVRLKGRLNIPALERCVSEVLRRHEALRTTFDDSGEQPVQVIASPRPMRLQVEDIAGADEQEIERLANEESQRPFDLAVGPLFRMRLLQILPEDHVALVAMHHIVSDGWSMGILTREVATLYEAFANDEPSPLAELPIQYADFAYWQRQWLQGEVLERQLDFWKRHLGGGMPEFELATDRPRPAAPTNRGAWRSLPLGPELARAVSALSRRENATPFMTLLAAFSILLARRAGSDQAVVGMPIANRNRAETEGLIGYFINILPLRVDLSGAPTFRQLVGRVREVALGAFRHQDMPLEKLVEELRPERSQESGPLIQVTFGVQNAPLGALNLPGLEWSPVPLEHALTRFDLTVWVWERDDSLGVTWTVNTDLFEPESIASMHEQFEILLGNIVREPDLEVEALELRTEAELEQEAFQKVAREKLTHRRLMDVKPKKVEVPQL